MSNTNSVTKKKTVKNIAKMMDNNINKAFKKRTKKKCEYEKNKLKLIKKDLKSQKKIVDKCLSSSYKYGFEALKLKQLLEIIKKENKENVLDLIKLFPFTGGKGIKVSQSHVFEALWFLIFLCNYDDMRPKDYKRSFKQSLETNEYDRRSFAYILDRTNVNESHKSGIADIFFEHINLKDNVDNNSEDVASKCMIDGKPISIVGEGCNYKESKKKKDVYLFSAKYLKKERGVKGYDIADIDVEAQSTQVNPKIILLVKDKDDVKSKMVRSKSNITKKYYEIFGLVELHDAYLRMLYDLSNYSLEEFIKESEKRNLNQIIGNEEITLRFHQRYVVDYTLEKIKKPNNNKFIWGAVPRSGKTFMIGGFIKEYKPQNVVIFLGAVSETQKQFEQELFDEYKGTFSDYKIYNKHSEDKNRQNFDNINEKDKNIILVSIQLVWGKSSNEKALKPEYIKLDQIIKGNTKKVVFFDEAHQGSKGGESVKNVLNDMIFKSKNKFPFVMVTATFASPLLKYSDGWGENTNLVQWSYEDIEYMKEIKKDDSYQSLTDKLSDETDGDTKTSIFKKLIGEFSKKNRTREQLSMEYEKYPELIVLSPNIENIDSKKISSYAESTDINLFEQGNINIKKIFKLEGYPNKKEFKYDRSVSKLLDYIHDNVYEKLLLNRFNFNVLEKRHTQLWFLPTNIESIVTDKKIDEYGDDKGFIEPVTRKLAFKISEKMGFHFCVIVVHSQKDLRKKILYQDLENKKGRSLKYDELDINIDVIDSEKKKSVCVSTQCTHGDVKKCIKEQTACAYMRGKSVIILTGARLRLGISLPCVDIALHMDPIYSVDTIYQSMFRVLTERRGKKRGFFVDMLKDRLIQFMYEYDNYTNKSLKKNVDIESQKLRLKQKLISWNFNGINEFERNDDEYLPLYNSLINSFGLNSNTNFYKNIETYQHNNNIEHILESIPKLTNNVYKNLKIIGLDFNELKREKIIKKLLERKTEPNIVNSELEKPKNSKKKTGNDLDNKSNDTEEKKLTPKQKNNIVTSYIKSIFSLYALLKDKLKDCSIDNIENLKKLLNTKINKDDLDKLCDEENDTLIECHVSFLLDFKKPITNEEKRTGLNEETLKLKKLEILNIYREQIIDILDEINSEATQELLKLYCFTKDKLNEISKNPDKEGAKILRICDKANEEEKTKINSDLKQNQGGGSKEADKPELINNETVLNTIRKYLTVRDKEKKLFGEVFTPVELVCEMLDKLPKEVWKDPKLKWLDPANGIGNFPVVAYYKLMEGLKDVKGFEDSDKRSKHIIENMLYMVELNPVNVKVCKKIFKMIDSKAEPNISNSNTLAEEDKWKSKFGIDKFDIIMGNPPYQHKKTGQKKSQAIWPNFVENSINSYLRENGYLLFVHPNNWRNIDGDYKKIFNRITERDLQHLTMRTFEDGAKTFGGSGTNFDYYCIKNILTKKNKTKINDIDRNELDLDLNSYTFIPSGKFNIFEKLIKGDEKVSIVYDRTMYGNDKPWMNKEKKGDYEYPIVYTITQKDGLNLWYSSKKEEMFVPKVIISNGLGTYPIIDSKGKYGLSNFSYGIQDLPKYLEYIKNALNDPQFISLMEYVRFLNTKYNYKIIGAFKKDFWKEFDYKNEHKSSNKKTKKNNKKPEPKPKPKKTKKKKKKLVIINNVTN